MIPWHRVNLSWLLVAVTYGVGVFLARRAGADLPKRTAALFFVLVFGFLWRPLTQDVVIVPADVLKLVEPWSAIRAPGKIDVPVWTMTGTPRSSHSR